MGTLNKSGGLLLRARLLCVLLLNRLRPGESQTHYGEPGGFLGLHRLLDEGERAAMDQRLVSDAYRSMWSVPVKAAGSVQRRRAHVAATHVWGKRYTR